MEPKNSKLIAIFAAGRPLYRPDVYSQGGKSGQHRAPCFLAGRSLKGDSNVTENNHPDIVLNDGQGTGEKAR
jgi:hypothetical protein